MLADLLQRAEVDLQQHRNDHHPDQQADGKIDLGDLEAADGLKWSRERLTEEDAGYDAKEDPKRQIALEGAHRCWSRAGGEGRYVHLLLWLEDRTRRSQFRLHSGRPAQRWPMSLISRSSAIESRPCIGSESMRSMRRFSVTAVARNAFRFSSSLPTTAAGSGTPQCAVIG